jgi:hypothetical protein
MDQPKRRGRPVRPRVGNLRPSAQGKQILEQIKEHRDSQGRFASLTSLWIEAVFAYYADELKEIKQLKSASKQTAA